MLDVYIDILPRDLPRGYTRYKTIPGSPDDTTSSLVLSNSLVSSVHELEVSGKIARDAGISTSSESAERLAKRPTANDHTIGKYILVIK